MRSSLDHVSAAAADVAGLAVGAVLAAVAGVRRGKAVHPHGVVHRARLVASGSPDAPRAATLLSQPGEHDALVRFSRSVGVPRPLPDLLGMSIRVVDAYGHGSHQDLLLVTSVDLPVLHHIFVPAGDVQQRPYSSSLPYRAGDERFLVGALPDPASPRPDGDDEFDRLAAAAATGRLSFRLAVAAVAGRFRPVADLRIGERLPDSLDALCFNPFNTGGGLVPTSMLNDMRRLAYPMSQVTWRAAQSQGAARQERAERDLRRIFAAAERDERLDAADRADIPSVRGGIW